MPWAEAHRLSQLSSKFLVDVLNADVVNGMDVRFLVTPIVDLGDLESAAQGGGLSLKAAVRAIQQVATGLDRGHAESMVHRDVKPGNVLLDGDIALLADLEMCALLDASGRAGRDGSFCTLAPETAPDDGYCSIPSDVYSLAATAFFALSGEYPVDHRLTKSEQRDQVAAGRIRELRGLSPHVPQGIRNVVRTGLRAIPGDRAESAFAFGNALARAARDLRGWRREDHDGHRLCLDGVKCSSSCATQPAVVLPTLRMSAYRWRSAQDDPWTGEGAGLMTLVILGWAGAARPPSGRPRSQARCG